MLAVDTGILLRLLDRGAAEHAIIRQGLRLVRSGGEVLVVSPQNLAEFWNVCTRPATARGGYGLSIVATEQRLRVIERLCRVLPDSPAAYSLWRQLVIRHAVRGVQVHDARLVAWMQARGLDRILTLNAGDFARYPGIAALHPRDLLRRPIP